MGYFQITFILIIYISFLIFEFACSKNMIITPEVCFTVCFLPQLCFALFYVKKWELNLNDKTVLVYILGVAIFALASIFFRQKLFKSKFNSEFNSFNTSNRHSLSTGFLSIFVFFQIASLFLTAEALKRTTGFSSLPQAIENFGKLSKALGLELPQLAGKCNLICYSSSFVWAYYLAYSIVFKDEQNKRILLIINLVLSCIHHLFTGSRGGVIQVAITFFIIWYILNGNLKGWKSVIRLKTFLGIIAACLAILLTFRLSLSLLGRSVSVGESYSDYMARYICAEIKNLDLAISQGLMGIRNPLEWDTTQGINNFLFKISSYAPKFESYNFNSYMTFNGYQLGNVYTIYMSFIHDLGIGGLFVFLPIMAIICQYTYKYAINSYKSKFKMNFATLLYSYFTMLIFFSFFSNWFYSNVFSGGFLWTVLIWIVIRFFCENKILSTKRKYITERVRL